METEQVVHHRLADATTAAEYDVSALKSDYVRLIVPSSAVPLGASEYSLTLGSEHADSSAVDAILTFDDDLSKTNETHEKDGDTEEEEDTSSQSNRGCPAPATPVEIVPKERPSMEATLPCPRICGACFSGPNMLVVFDSRAAFGQTHITVAMASAAPGKASKPPSGASAVKSLPRTYGQLLDTRDSRIGKKKNKKLMGRTAGGLSGVGIAGGAMGFLHTGIYGSGDDGDHSVHGYRGGVSGGGGSFFNADTEAMREGGMDGEFAVHGGSEYLKMYFSTSEFHLPVNHPDHRISLPPSASSIQGLSLSPPRSKTTSVAGLRPGNGIDYGMGFGQGMLGQQRSSLADIRAAAMRTVDQPPSSLLQSDQSLSVTVLDLSRLCGVSSVLTYATQLSPTEIDEQAKEATTPAKLDAGTKDLYAWMLQATGSRRVSGGSARSKRRADGTMTSHKTHPLSRILQSLLIAGGDGSRSEVTTQQPHSVSDVCAHNARIASLAGRSDLHQVWSLLELSTASNVQLPQQQHQKTVATAATSGAKSNAVDSLVTMHPWRAHPFGQNLVEKMLSMYETAGDLPTLATIVCALQPPQPQDEDDGVTYQMMQQRQQQQPRLAADSNSQLADKTTASTVSTSTAASTPVAKVTTSPFSRSRTSFNSLSQLLSGQSDATDPAPPTMRSARRSSSHNEVPKLSQMADSATVTGYKATAKDWPVAAARGSNSSRSPDAGWKGLEFDKLENPFKTWSAGSSAARADASPRPLTDDTFRSPHSSAGILAMAQRRRGSSIMDGDDDASLMGRIVLQVDKRHSEDDHHVLSTHPDDEQRYDGYKEAYAELLYRYGALDLRSDVLKASTTAEAPARDEDADDQECLTFGVLCRSCQVVTTGLYCAACRDFAVKCSICMLAVRGQSMYCMTCGHGGHAHHLREWFEEEDACPTGCGCWCKQATAMAHHAEHKEVTEDGAAERAQSRSYSF